MDRQRSGFYIALLHFPMRNRRGEIVATALTSMDVPDIARSARTYGAKRYFIATPLPSQQHIATVLRDFWFSEDPSSTRRQAMELVHICANLGDCYEEIEQLEGKPPFVLGTSARDGLPYPLVDWPEARRLIAERPVLVCFGTGHGMADELLQACEGVLPPVKGGTEYNHLSVRAAVAIVLDRLKGVNHGRDG